MKKETQKMNNTELIAKGNALINASYNLSLVEIRLILLAIVEGRKTGNGFKDTHLEIHASTYAKQFGVDLSTAYKVLKEACVQLFDRQFSYQETSKRSTIRNAKSRWVQDIGYIDNEAIVDLIFSVTITPLITRLESNFSTYDINNVSQFSSRYAIQLYELINSWRNSTNKKTPCFEIVELKEIFGLAEANKYASISDFKKNVIDLSVDQINKYSDLEVSYEQKKRGRTISGLIFFFKEKKSLKTTKQLPPSIPKLTEKQRYLFAQKLAEIPQMADYSRVGETTEEFAQKLAEMLLIPENVKKFFPFLKQVGYK